MAETVSQPPHTIVRAWRSRYGELVLAKDTMKGSDALGDVLRPCGVEPELQQPVPDPSSVLVCGPIRAVLQGLAWC